jgi:putative DNA primase/helicase
MVVVSEIPRGVKLASKLINDLTGRDKVSVRFLFKEFFDLDPSFKLWIYGNHKPEIEDRENGIWRRVHLVPFTAEIPDNEKDPKLQSKIIDQELSGVLNWLIDGCLEWQRIGLAIPDEVKAATQEYKAEGDTLGRFIDECAVVNPNARARAGRFQDAYKDFCRESGSKPLPGKEIWAELEKRGITKDQNMYGVHYAGIGLLETQEAPDHVK